MPFCPNLSNPEVKQQFDELVKKYGENKAYYLWDKYQGVVPTEFVVNNEEYINNYFTSRFGENSVFIKDSLKNVDNAETLGFVQSGAAHLSKFAPLDTAYHEAFHIFFRTTLNEKQRAQLYKDAVKLYGEPTAKAIEKAKTGQPGISEENARLLAIEEKMAEEFRFYSMAESAPKTLSARIARYFKNLLAYIKALVGMPLTVRQAYRLLESNKIPASFVRDITQFDGTAYMVKELMDYRIHGELSRVGATIVVDSYDQLLKETDPSDRKAFRKAASIKARQLMGDAKTKKDSEVRDYFLRLTVRYADGGMLSKEDFADYKRLYDKGDIEAIDQLQEERGIYDAPPLRDVAGKELSKKFEEELEDGDISLAEYFGVVYDNWYDEQTESGRTKTGFRTDIAALLPEFGFNLSERDVLTDDIEERIYSITRLEQDPGKTLTQKQRILLSRIPLDNLSRTVTGLRTYVPAMQVYRSVIDTVADSENFSEMLNKLEEKGKFEPTMRAVYNFINNLEADQQASLFYAFNVAAQQFVRIELESTGKGKTKTVSSRVYSPNLSSVIKSVELEWRRSSVLPGGFLKGSREGGFLVNQKKLARIEQLAKKIGISQGRIASSSLTKQQQADFAEMLMLLGMEIAPTTEEAINRVQTVFENGLKFRLFMKRAKIAQIVKNLEGKQTVALNFLENEGSTVKAVIGEFVAPFETAKAQAFVDSLLRSIYPINSKSRLNNEELRVRNGKLLADLRGTLQHDVGGRTSILFKMLSNPKFVDKFEFRTLEAFGEREEGDEMENNVYEEMDFEKMLAARLNAWYNKGKKEGEIAMDTMGDRKRMVFATMDRLTLREVAQQYGYTEAEILGVMIEDEMLLDFNDMRQAQKEIQAAIESGSIADLIEGFHYRIDEDTGQVDYSLGGWTNFNTMNMNLDVDKAGNPLDSNMLGLMIGAEMLLSREINQLTDKDQKQLDILTEGVQNAIRLNAVELGAMLGIKENEDGKLEVKPKTRALSFLLSNIDNGALGSNPAEFLEEFATYDYIGRIMTRSMFRGGLKFTKDGGDYVKRAQLITTPGPQGVIKGDLPANRQYGLSKTFNASTVRDIMMRLPEGELAKFREKLIPLVGERAAEEIVRSYKNIVSTDAQAFISPKHFYEIMQHKGKVDNLFEEVYEKYLETGKWDPRIPIAAMKPSYDGTVKKDSGHGVRLVPFSDKTSYVVLTRELVAGIPILEELLDRMEAVNEYEGMETIEVVHTESAQKLAIVPAHAVRFNEGRGQFAELVVQEMDSQFLRFPEEVPIKEGKEQIKLGHQAKVNMLTNIVSDGIYVYNDGLSYALPVTGEQLQNVFHGAVSEKMKRAMDDIYKQIGYDKVLAAETEEQRQEAMAEFNVKVTKMLNELSTDKDFNESILDALAIAPGSSQTALPLGSFNLQGKYDQLIFALLRNRVFRQYVKGQQMVQFADFGGKVIDETLQENLQFLSVDGNRIAHAEVDLRADFLERIGIGEEKIQKALETGDVTNINEELRRVMGYRIPQQGKSSLLIMKIRQVLPKSHDGVIRVPPGITKQMGSDFDVDKMFIMFPELEEIDGQVKKLRVPYKQIMRDTGKMWILSEEQLNQVIFDTFEAVASNINHVHETFSPLDGKDLKIARDKLNILKNKQGKKLNIFSTTESIQSAVRNMISHRLRGVWADAVLGRNVLFGAQLEEGDLDGVTMKFIDNQQTVTSVGLKMRSVFEDVTGTTRPTDYFPSLHLGSAVDSVKDPLQEDINDSVLTFKIESYLYARGLTPTQVSVFLNHPEVRAVTDQAKRTGSSIAKTLKGKRFRKTIGKDSSEAATLNFSRMRNEIADYGSGEYKRDPAFAREVLQALKSVNTEANDLYNLYNVITLFTIDKAGTTAQNLSMFDKVEYFLTKTSEGSIYGGKKIISKILEGDAYLSARTTWETIQSGLELATAVGLLSNQEGFKMFRKAVMEAGKGSPFREQGQRVMLNAVHHHIATKPGSPLFEQGFLDKLLVETLLFNEDKEGSILYEFQKMKELLKKKGRFNALLENLEVARHEFDSKKVMHYLEFNNRKQRGTPEENAMIAGWEELYFNTNGIFNEEEAELARNFAKHLLTNSMVTTGGVPGPRSMINIVPTSIQQDIGYGEYFTKELEALRTGTVELTDEFLEDFFIHYGGYKYGGETFVSNYQAGRLGIKKLQDRLANEETVSWDKEDASVPPPIIYIPKVGLVKVEGTFFGENTKGQVTFTVLKRRSARGRFFEHNLRTEDGKVFDGSLISEERQLKKPKGSGNNKSARTVIQEEIAMRERALEALEGETEVNTDEGIEESDSQYSTQAASQAIEDEDLGEPAEEDEIIIGPKPKKSVLNLSPHESPRGVQEKIARLTSSFAAAGVDIQFVLAELPAGTKGMVEGNIVTLDPAQIGEDTAYHEVGHILIDMLPEDEVRQYAKQAEAASPEIAAMVREEYAKDNLTEFEMQKEILVTAIGLEGAKIERKNPSKLQILINRILRAIGKLFGITPNAAAVLAERMFAGDIKSMSLNKQFNPRIQRSRKLEKKIDKVFEEAYQNLERQIRELKFKPESKRTKAEILKIKQIQSTLAQISENKETINGFFTFSEYVHEQVEIAKNLFTELRKIKGNPVKREDALELLNKIDELNHTMSTFFNSRSRANSLVDKVRNVVSQIVVEKEDKALSSEVLRNLTRSITELENLEEEYIELVAPIVADAYGSYMNSEINRKIDEVIDSVRKNKDTSGLRGDIDYQDLVKRKGTIKLEAERKGLNPEEEWKNAVLDLKIKKLQAKKLNRDTIIKELTDAYVDKSSFSLWLDPMVYSSEANLQMFAMSLNEGNFNANRQSIELINSAVEKYENFKDFMGISDVNKSKFYGDLLTVVTVRRGDGRGGYTTNRMLSIVQPYDTDLYYNNMYTFLDRLALETRRPEYDPTDYDSKKKYKAWMGSPQGREYARRKAAWFSENTVPVAGAEAKLTVLRNEKVSLLNQLKMAEAEGRSADAAVLQEYVNEVTTRIRASYHAKSKTFMGELAQPKGWKGKPRQSEKLYASEKYEKIESTPQLKEMYDFLIETYKEKQKPYGQNNPQFINMWDTFSYIAPSVRQSNIEAVGRLGLKGVITEAKDVFKRTDTDQELYGAAVNAEGMSERFLPRYYTNPVDEKEISRDILSSILMFSHRSNQYVERSKLTGLVNAMGNLHKERRVIQKDSTGGGLLNREAVRFKQKFEDYAIDTTATTPGGSSNTVNHLMQFIDSAFYGIHKKKLETKILGMDPNKLVGTANSLAALGSLSLNFLQIGNQYILDNLMIVEEAVAGEFFGKGDFAWAEGMLVSNGSGISDIGRFTAKSKLGKLMMHFDALVEVTDSLGQDASSNKFLKVMKTGNLLAFQGAVEYTTAAKRMLAAMKALEGTFVDKNGDVILNEDGNEANLWDLMIETEKGVELDPRVDKEKSGFNEAMFMAKLRGLYKRTNQVKGNFDASTLSRTPFGAFLMLFKNYFIPGWRKRWGHGDMYHRDLELGTVTRGMYFSFGNYLKLVYKNGMDFRGVWENSSPVDKQNIKRTGTEMVSLGIVMGMFSALMSVLDDDDEDSYLAAFSAYQARRLQTELFAYLNPGEAFRMFVSPMAAANRMQKWWQLMTHFATVELRYDAAMLFGEPSEALTKKAIYQRDSYWGEKGDRKIWGKIGKVMPMIYGISTLDAATVEDKIRFFDD